MNFPGATAFLLLFPFPTGVCFYCMPRCLSFQKTDGHDEQQKQRPEALGRGLQRRWGVGRPKCHRNGFLLLLLSLVSFAEFYCITMNCALTKFGQQMKRNEWEIDAKKMLQRKKHIRNTFQDSFVIFL